jgi:hypothetical protein
MYSSQTLSEIDIKIMMNEFIQNPDESEYECENMVFKEEFVSDFSEKPEDEYYRLFQTNEMIFENKLWEIKIDDIVFHGKKAVEWKKLYECDDLYLLDIFMCNVHHLLKKSFLR